MPFDQANLSTLIQTSAFSLWHYRSTDSRATVVAAGYFTPVSAVLRPGDVMLLQAADAFALLPVRSNAAFGTGVTLDGPIGPVKLSRSAAAHFSVRQVASAIVRTIVLAPLAAGLVVGAALPVAATVVGPINQVVFSLRDGSGAVIPPIHLVTVHGGQASAVLATPPVGNGYRIRVEDAADPRLAVVSQSFSIGADYGLLLDESDDRLLTESGAALQQ